MALRDHEPHGRRTTCVNLTYLGFRIPLLLLEFTALILVGKGMACFPEIARNASGYMTQFSLGIIAELACVALIIRLKPGQSLWPRMRRMAGADALLTLLCAAAFVIDAIVDPRADRSVPKSFYLDDNKAKNQCRNKWMGVGGAIAMVCGCLHFLFMAASCVECCIGRSRSKKENAEKELSKELVESE